MLRRLDLDGDRQADLEVHGGPAKAVYAYASEHYPLWREELRDPELRWANFGENFTTEGLLEADACIGDRFRIGEALVMVTQPRFPCYKLGIRFGRDDIIEKFLKSGRSGIYFAVLEEGLVNCRRRYRTSPSRSSQPHHSGHQSGLYKDGRLRSADAPRHRTRNSARQTKRPFSSSACLAR